MAIQVAAPTVFLVASHASVKRVVTFLSTLIRYTDNGAYGETYDPSAVPTTALIHGRVTR